MPISPVSPQQVRNKLARAKVRVFLLCRVVSQIPLQRLVASLLRTCWRADQCRNKSAASTSGKVTGKRVK